MFTLLYGVDGYNYTPFADARVSSWPMQQVKQSGYSLHGVSASRLREWNRAGFIAAQFDEYREFLAGSGDANDAEMVAWIRRFAASRATRDPFVLFTFFASTHANYFYPPAFEVDTPVAPVDFDYFEDDEVLRKRSTEIFNRYKNSVRYVDHLFGQVVEAFKDDIADGRLVVFLSGDHGEEFWDHGKLGHASQRFIEARTRVPLLFCIPGVERSVELSGHVDAWPTILHYMQGVPVEAARFSSGRSLLTTAEPRHVVITGAGFPDRSSKLAVVSESGKLWLSRKKSALDRFDLIRATTLDDQVVPIRKQDAEIEAPLSRSIRRFLRVGGQ